MKTPPLSFVCIARAFVAGRLMKPVAKGLLLSAIVSLALVSGPDARAQLDRVPGVEIDFEESVTAWWERHPLNPEGVDYQPVIASPAHTVQLSAGADIGAAIQALPASGGTIELEPGNYSGDFKIVGQNNVHLIAPRGAVLEVSTGLIIAGCEESIDYDAYNFGFKQRRPAYLDCWFNRIENIYLKNLTFDGGGESLGAIHIKTSNGVMIDACEFRNMVDPQRGHGALVNAHAGADSVWVRDSHF